jgi:tetratricopeptide (TPR) repeat protein
MAWVAPNWAEDNIQSLVSQSQLSRNQRDYTRAEELAEKALILYEGDNNKISWDRLSIMRELEEIRFARGDFRQAEPYFREAFSLASQTPKFREVKLYGTYLLAVDWAAC